MPRAPRPSRRFTAVTCLTVLALGGVGTVPAALAAPGPGDAEELLASLDADQLAVLDRLSTLQVSGLQDLDDDVRASDEPVDVIVSLTQPPATTAQLLAATQGQTLTDSAAQDAVSESQESFDDALAEAFPTSRDAREATPQVEETYTDAFNGVSMTLPGTELETLAGIEGVAAVWPDDEVHATSAPVAAAVPAATEDDDQAAIAAGLARLHDEGVTGEGVTVGVIDTGIDYHHPDLADVYAGGRDLVDGDDDPMETTYADWQATNRPETSNGSTYYTEHGTHVAGIIAGQGDTATERAAHGVAPDAKIRAYRVLGPYGSGSTSAVLAGMDAALQDDVDVVNMSLGAPSNDSLSPQALAADHLVLSGITTVIAAGNSGPAESTLGTPGAAALPITVGANDTPMELGRYAATVGGTTAEARLLARSYADVDDAIDGTHALVPVGLGRSADYSGKDVAGKVAVVQRGTITLNEKVERAATKGAVAVLLVNNVADEGHVPNYLGEAAGFVPAFSVTAADGAAIADALAADPTATVTLAEDGTFTLGGDQLAPFSSRGPVYGTGTIKPEVTAPGVSVMSSIPVDVVDPEGRDYSIAYARLSGTSMASPYVAGVAALMLQDDPRRTPADVKVALMNTAAPLEGSDDVFGVGAGQVDPWSAVHASVSAAVRATTTQVDAAGETSTLRHETGAVDFGTLPAGKAVLESAVVEVQGHAKGITRYDVSVATTGSGPDAAKNRVRLSVQKSLTLAGSAKRRLPVLLSAPASATAGSYQGVVTLTPRDADLPTLRLPFGVRLATTGLAELTMPKPVLSTHQGTGDGLAAGGQGQFAFRMAGQLTELRIFLADQKGKDVGYVGTLRTVGLAPDVLYGASFTGSYFPLTGDRRNPVSPKARWAAEGGYRFKVIGVDAYGRTFTKSEPIYVDTTAPTYDDAFGAFDPTTPTVVERPADAISYPLDGVLTDPSVAEIRAAGIDIDQSDNKLQWSIYSPVAPERTTMAGADGA
ncbi:S8 family serine peptidase, partial [Isoptericola hypogeus]